MIVEFGHQRVVSFVTAAAAANAVDVCPDGNDARSPDLNPCPKSKSFGFDPLVTNGRPRPATPLIIYVTASARSTASDPCQPRSAMRSWGASRPTPYKPAPITYAPGLAITSTPVEAFFRNRLFEGS